MKRFSAPWGDPSRPPNDDESDASLSDGSSKRVKTAQSFESLFNSESLSDISLHVAGTVFHAHKMIVGLKSERLAALITALATSPTDNQPHHHNSSGAATDVTTSFTDGVTNGNLRFNHNNNVNNVNSINNLRNRTTPNNNSSSGSSSNNNNGSTGSKPVLYLQESPECGAVFSRFLYFIYSGAVWLHRDYVVPLFQLSLKYGVVALAAHCENYIAQLLQKCLDSTESASGAAGAAPCLSVTAVCDLCEEEGCGDDTRHSACALLARRFAELSRTDRWATCRWATVRDLLRSDECSSDENLILVAATDWMKRNKLQDRSQIQEVLTSIRYPRLPRRVLYHLYTTASFKNFPGVQTLIEAAIKYHCFKDVPEAQGDYTGLQYRSRGGRQRSAGPGDDTALGGAQGVMTRSNIMQDSDISLDSDTTHPHMPVHGFWGDAPSCGEDRNGQNRVTADTASAVDHVDTVMSYQDNTRDSPPPFFDLQFTNSRTPQNVNRHVTVLERNVHDPSRQLFYSDSDRPTTEPTRHAHYSDRHLPLSDRHLTLSDRHPPHPIIPNSSSFHPLPHDLGHALSTSHSSNPSSLHSVNHAPIVAAVSPRVQAPPRCRVSPTRDPANDVRAMSPSRSLQTRSHTQV